MNPDINITAAASMYGVHSSSNYFKELREAEGEEAKKAVPRPVLWSELDAPNKEFWLSIAKHMSKVLNPEKKSFSGMAESLYGKFGKKKVSFDPAMCVSIYLNVRNSFHATA